MNKKPNIYSETLKFRVEPCDGQRLRQLAAKRQRPTSIILRKALRDFLEKELNQVVQ